MLSQQFRDAQNDLVHRQLVAVYNDIGRPEVQRAPGGEQFACALLAVRPAEEGAHVRGRTEPPDDVLRRDIQVHDTRAPAQRADILFTQRHAAATGDDHAIKVRDIANDLGLKTAELDLTALREDIGNRHAGTLLDKVVRLDEAQAEYLGEAAAHGGLAGTHEADKRNIATRHDATPRAQPGA
jgi:hypothetical protein